MPEETFTPIGQKVEDIAPGATEETQAEDDQPRGVEEIESLCMNCHENVSWELSQTVAPYGYWLTMAP